MSKGNTFENDFLALIFLGTTIAGLARNDSPANGFLYFALHNADPGEGGNQSTNECGYGDYARVAVPRTTAGFTVSGNSAVLAEAINFPPASAGDETATHYSLGTAASGTGKILYKAALEEPVPISLGVIPKLTTQTAVTED